MKLLFWGKTSDTHTCIIKGDHICIYWSKDLIGTNDIFFEIKGGEVIEQCNTYVLIKIDNPFGKISLYTMQERGYRRTASSYRDQFPYAEQFRNEGGEHYTWASEGEGYVFFDPTGRRAVLDSKYNVLDEQYFTNDEKGKSTHYIKDLKKKKTSSLIGWAVLAGVFFYLYKTFFGDK